MSVAAVPIRHIITAGLSVVVVRGWGSCVQLLCLQRTNNDDEVLRAAALYGHDGSRLMERLRNGSSIQIRSESHSHKVQHFARACTPGTLLSGQIDKAGTRPPSVRQVGQAQLIHQSMSTGKQQEIHSIKLLDGGMGHLIKQWGVAIPGLAIEQQFLAGCLALRADPSTVLRAHKAYIEDAGCDIITTTNFVATLHSLGKVQKAQEHLRYCQVGAAHPAVPCCVCACGALTRCHCCCCGSTASRPASPTGSRCQPTARAGGWLAPASERKVRVASATRCGFSCWLDPTYLSSCMRTATKPPTCQTPAACRHSTPTLPQPCSPTWTFSLLRPCQQQPRPGLHWQQQRKQHQVRHRHAAATDSNSLKAS